MTHQQFEELIEDQLASIQRLTRTKGREYARNDDDKLSNFKRLGQTLGFPPETVLFVYLSKHLDAIAYFVANQAWNSKDEVPSEPIVGRIDDAILYLILLKALLSDRGNDEIKHQ